MNEYTLGDVKFKNDFEVKEIPLSRKVVFQFNKLEQPALELHENGDIFVRGKLVENDKEVVDGLRDMLKLWRGDL